MSRPVDHFRRILVAEARDLQADLASLREKQMLRFQAREISEHVCRENCAVFNGEIRSIDAFVAFVEAMDLSGVTTLEEAMAKIRADVHSQLEGTLQCPCVLEQIDRKMEKVRAYVAGPAT